MALHVFFNVLCFFDIMTSDLYWIWFWRENQKQASFVYTCFDAALHWLLDYIFIRMCKIDALGLLYILHSLSASPDPLQAVSSSLVAVVSLYARNTL